MSVSFSIQFCALGTTDGLFYFCFYSIQFNCRLASITAPSRAKSSTTIARLWPYGLQEMYIVLKQFMN